MAARRRTPRDQRRRSLGQNFLAWPSVVERFLGSADLSQDDRVLELGPGTGALTLPLARVVARVIAVERDPVWARRLRQRVREEGLADRVRVVTGDLRQHPLPEGPYRVVSNVPFGVTTALLRRLLDDPQRGPSRADLLVQREVAVKRAQVPPSSLLSARWAPWWSFELGPVVPRQAFRPVPRVDAAWLVVRKREPAVLPPWLAPSFEQALRAAWEPPAGVNRRR